MKSKDIEIGREYAVGAANASYGEPVRCRVVKVGVYGITRPRNSWRYFTSDRPNYVEVEPIEEGHLLHGRCSVRLDNDKPLVGSHLRDTPPVRKAYRVPANQILRPWAEQEKVNAAEAERRQRKDAAREQAALDRRWAQAWMARNLGVKPGTASNRYSGELTLTITPGQVKQIAEKLGLPLTVTPLPSEEV